MTWPRRVVVLVVTLLATPAMADVLCRAKRGSVFVRTECRKRETAVPLPVVLPKGPDGTAGADAPPPVRVVDATGKPVGLFAEPGIEDHATFAIFELGGRLVHFLVNREGIFGENRFSHVAADCSDEPLVAIDPTALVNRGTVIGPTAYVAADPIERRLLLAQEFPPFPGGCGSATLLPNGNCCQEAFQPFEATTGSPAVAFQLSEFALPLRLEP